MKNTPRNLMSFYRKSFPANFPVKFRWVDSCDDASIATCCLETPKGKRPYFMIELSKRRLAPFKDTWWIVRETIMHEYAHALSWTPAHRNYNDHGPLFGVAYAMLYEPTLKKFPSPDGL